MRSPEGLSITKSKLRFISAETLVSTYESGQYTFYLWEKWEKIENFENYIQDPHRNPECEFMQKWLGYMNGESRMVLPEILDL